MLAVDIWHDCANVKKNNLIEITVKVVTGIYIGGNVRVFNGQIIRVQLGIKYVDA